MKELVRIILYNLGITLLYIIAGKLGLTLAFVNASATAIWPPTGIALAAFLLFGYIVIPAIFFVAFFVNLLTAGTIATSIGIALGNTLEGMVGAYLVKKFCNGLYAFDSVWDIFKFTFFAAILSTMISADIGVTTLILGSLASWSDFTSIWLTWWLGDMGGALIIAPFLLVWGRDPQFNINFKRVLHLLISLISLFIVTMIVFTGILPYPYLCIPIAVWLALWFGQKGATCATIITAAITIFYTLHGQGPFATASSINHSLILLQLFLGIFSLTGLTFGATVLACRISEKALMSHERRFKALIENSFDGVVLIDATSKIIYASPSVKRVLDYTPEELIGKTGFDLVVPEHRNMTMRELAKLVLKPGGIVTVEYQTIRKDKKIIWVEATGTNLLFEPSVNAVVVNFHDITEKQIAKETIFREKLEDEAMLNSIGDGIIATDSKGRIAVVNKVTCETLGWKERELIGRLIVDAVAIENEFGKILPENLRPITKVLSLGKKIVTSRTNYYIRRDKTKFPVRITVTPITVDNKLVGAIEVFHDITKEKEIDRMKDEFISMASHELRTPITAIKGYLSMILHGDYGPVNDGLKKPLENIAVSTHRQIILINDLLDVSRLQTGRIDFRLTNFAINSLLEEIINSLQPLARQKGIQINAESKQELSARGDIEWVRHILNNLIGNALKFTDQGKITLTYHQDHNLIHIAVTDTGTGIDPADHGKLFEKFAQLKTHKLNRPVGSGLGLYLSRQLANKMGGDVKLKKSSPGQGSTFALILPRADTDAASKIKSNFEQTTQIAFNDETG